MSTVSIGFTVSPGHPPLTQGDIDVWTGGGFGFDSVLNYVPIGQLIQTSDTQYQIEIDSTGLLERLHFGIPVYEYIDGVWVKTEYKLWFDSTAHLDPPTPVPTILSDKTFIRNSETIDIKIVYNRSPNATLNASDLSVTAGSLRNFSGSGRGYRVQLTAPASGIGFIRLEISGEQVYEIYTYAPEPTGDIFFLSPRTPHHLNREKNTHFIREITAADLDTINDFGVIIPFSENVSLSADAIEIRAVDSEEGGETEISLQSFSGKKSVYEIVMRPPTDGGSGTIFITIPENATAEGNPEKQFEMFYTDEIFIPEWETLFQTDVTYNDIVSVAYAGVQLLRDSQIDFFSFQGEMDTTRRVVLPEMPTVTRAVKYDTDKYLGLATSNNSKAHLFVAGATEWSSASVWTLATDRSDPQSDLQGLAVSDWAWTRDRRLILVSMSFLGNPPQFGALHDLELHDAIRRGIDLNDVAFDSLSLNDGYIEVGELASSVAIAHADEKLFVATNETGDIQNYIFVYDANDTLLPAQRIPVTGRTKSLFAKNGWLYRYNDTNKTLLRYSLDLLRSPEPKVNIYPVQVAPGESIDLRKVVNFADVVLFDTGFDKPPWLTIEGNFFLKVDPDAIPKSTAYVRLRGVSRTGASQMEQFGFYIYVQTHRTPQWKDFESLSKYPEQVLNMLELVDDADFVEWQHGFRPPSDVNLDDNGKIT